MKVFFKLGGKYVGCEPGTSLVYANRDKGDWWEDIELAILPNTKAVATLIAINQVISIQPDSRIELRPAGTTGPWEQLDLLLNGPVPLATRLGKTFEIEGYQAQPPASAIHLEQRGNDFVDANGQRTVLCGCDMFLAYRQFLDGGAAALVPFVMESREIGFTCWRVFMQGSKAQNQVMDLSPIEPRYYENLKPFAETLNVNGIIPLATVYVDNQDVKADLGHWSRVADRLRGTATLLSGFNQWTKNKSNFDPWALPDPGGFIWSRGSDIEDTETAPRGASASELHATRISFDRALMDATASPPTMRQHGAGMCWMTEGAPFDDGSSPFEAWALGRAYSILWALACLHNRQSQRGLLMTPGTRRCAEAWVEGMRLP